MARLKEILRTPLWIEKAAYGPDSSFSEQYRLFHYLKDKIIENGCVPITTRRQPILDATGISSSNFAAVLEHLEEEGWFVTQRGPHEKTPTMYAFGRRLQKKKKTK